MTRSVLILDTYYMDALKRLSVDARIESISEYEVEIERVSEYGFGTGGSYSRALRECHWDSTVVIPNSLGLQDLWSREHGLRRPMNFGWHRMQVLTRPPIFRDVLRWLPHAHQVLLRQVQEIRPDVLFVQDINAIPPSLIRTLKKYAGVVIGEIASPLPPKSFITCYDRIISALPSIVERAHREGVPSTYLPLGFDTRWSNNTDTHQREIDVVFVGSFTRLQPNTAPLLRAIAKEIPGFRLYGSVGREALERAELTDHFFGPLWGGEMFKILGNSKIVINRHGSVAGQYAVNMRMYESTGSGAALVTEAKSNLSELFDINSEVVAYRDINDAVDKTLNLLANPDRLSELASNGHRRTLRDHTYGRRAERLIDIFEKDLHRLKSH